MVLLWRLEIMFGISGIEEDGELVVVVMEVESEGVGGDEAVTS